VVVAVATLGGCGGSNPALTFVEYGKQSPPAVPDRTAALDAAWLQADGVSFGAAIADGDYWGTLQDGAPLGEFPTRLSIRLVQAFFGPTCVAELGADSCDNDFGIVDDTTGTISVQTDQLGAVSIVTVDQRNYSISGAEFERLLVGQPSDLRPDNVRFVRDFPFLVTTRDGTVVALAQIWTP
jgi:hypothetical protein